MENKYLMHPKAIFHYL